MNQFLHTLRRLRAALPLVAAVTGLSALTACNPVDRSGEQPFPPTLESVSATVEGNVCLMTGRILTSVNSDILKRGFNYGNDTLRIEVESTDETDLFHATTRPLEPGRYFMVPFARNGVGITRSDTIYFRIGN